jgi:hypothetical protein
VVEKAAREVEGLPNSNPPKIIRARFPEFLFRFAE